MILANVSVASALSLAAAQDIAAGYRYSTLASFGTRTAEGALASPGVTTGSDGCLFGKDGLLYGTTQRGGNSKPCWTLERS